MITTEIIIGGTKFELKKSFRSLMEFEKMTGKNSFAPSTSITDTVTLFYCMMLAGNAGTFKMSFDEFLIELDNDDTIFAKFNEYLMTLIEAGTAKKDPETATVEKKNLETR